LDPFQKFFHFLFELLGQSAGEQFGEERTQRAYAVGDEHFVIVEHDQQVRPDMPGVLHRFKGHAAGDTAVADDRHHAMIFFLLIAGHGHSERR